MTPLIGISCCIKLTGTYGMVTHGASDTYVRAVDQVVGGVPVLIPANGDAADVDTLLDHLAGIILTGSRSNVQPTLYGGPPHPADMPEDAARDAVTMRLIQGAIARSIPVLAICRGLQELNVALGGTLHQRLQDLPGRLDHSTPMHPDARVRQGKAHDVKLVPGGWLHRLSNCTTACVNSLHHQGIDRIASCLSVDATAPDGTIEAVRHPSAPGYVAGVQWHPEYDFGDDPLSRAIFASFGAAVRTPVRERLAAD